MQRILRTCGNHSAGNNIEVFYNVFSFFSFTLGFSFFFKKRKLRIKTPLLNHIKSSTGFQLIASLLPLLQLLSAHHNAKVLRQACDGDEVLTSMDFENSD